MPGISAVHDFSGYLPSVHVGPIEIQTYFLVISLTLCLAVWGLVRRTEMYGLVRNTALDLAVVVMIGGFIGSRLLHVFFEEPRYYFRDPIQVLHIERGGFVWYGGLIAGFLSGALFSRWRKLPLRTWMDVFAPLLAFGYAMGRVACFLTGCCFGDVCFLASGYAFRYPTQLFAVIWEAASLAFLLVLERRGPGSLVGRRLNPLVSRGLNPSGRLFWVWLLLHSIGRIVMEMFRADDRGPMLAPMGISISVSTFLSLVFIGVAAWMLVRLNAKAPAKHDA